MPAVTAQKNEVGGLLRKMSASYGDHPALGNGILAAFQNLHPQRLAVDGLFDNPANAFNSQFGVAQSRTQAVFVVIKQAGAQRSVRGDT